MNEYLPDSVTPPVETVLETMLALGIDGERLRQLTRWSRAATVRFLSGEVPITARLAVDLETALGVPGEFWLDRQARYDEMALRAN